MSKKNITRVKFFTKTNFLVIVFIILMIAIVAKLREPGQEKKRLETEKDEENESTMKQLDTGILNTKEVVTEEKLKKEKKRLETENKTQYQGFVEALYKYEEFKNKEEEKKAKERKKEIKKAIKKAGK